MSACLFTMTFKGFDSLSMKELDEHRNEWLAVIDEFESKDDLHDNAFHRDRYSGYRANNDSSFYYLKGYERALRELKVYE